MRSRFSLAKPPAPWINLALIGSTVLIYAPLLLYWYQGWIKKTISIEHEYFSHGVIGLPFAAYLAWTLRHRWARLADPTLQEQLAGLGVAAIAAGLYWTGLPDLVNLSFPLMLGALGLSLKGTAGLRLQAFPLLLVLLATPNEIPYLLTPYTLPLQSFVAASAGLILNLCGMQVTIEGINLYTNGRLVEVAPYCAGLKMLFTSLYVALMLLYWTNSLRSRRIVGLFLVGTVGLSILSNIVRNTLLTFFHGTGRDGLFDWLHNGWGGDLYSAGLLGLLVLFINQLTEPHDRPSPAEAEPIDS